MDPFVCIRIRKSTRDLIRGEAKRVFLEHHPEMEGMKLTDNCLVLRYTKYYTTG